jgi:preprotein translocase subunit YajC
VSACSTAQFPTDRVWHHSTFLRLGFPPGIVRSKATLFRNERDFIMSHLHSLSQKSSFYFSSALAVVGAFLWQVQAFAQESGQAPASGPVVTPGTTASAAGAPPAWMNFVLLGGMILFMYLFIIRPNSKRQKEHKNFLESLAPGKEVITSSGLIGKVTHISDTIVTVDLGTTSVRVLKSAISGELGRAATGSSAPAVSST